MEIFQKIKEFIGRIDILVIFALYMYMFYIKQK